MALTPVKKRCMRCLKVMRNDGTEEEPKYVCNNNKCVRYVEPQEKSEDKPAGEAPVVESAEVKSEE